MKRPKLWGVFLIEVKDTSSYPCLRILLLGTLQMKLAWG